MFCVHAVFDRCPQKHICYRLSILNSNSTLSFLNAEEKIGYTKLWLESLVHKEEIHKQISVGISEQLYLPFYVWQFHLFKKNV